MQTCQVTGTMWSRLGIDKQGNLASWWFQPTHLKNITIVKIGSFRGENRKSLKPPPRALEVFLLHFYICFSRVSRVSTCCSNVVICLSRFFAVPDLGRSSNCFSEASYHCQPVVANEHPKRKTKKLPLLLRVNSEVQGFPESFWIFWVGHWWYSVFTRPKRMEFTRMNLVTMDKKMMPW